MFYDPVVRQKEEIKDWKEAYKVAKEEAKELLTKQVEDFIKWLKNNNIKIE